MTDTPIESRNTAGLPWVEVDACTLPTVERPLRLAEFDELFARHLSTVQTTTAAPEADATAVMEFTGGPPVQAWLLDLTARESRCCSFFTFGVSCDDDRVVLSIGVPAGRADVLAALAGRAEALGARR